MDDIIWPPKSRTPRPRDRKKVAREDPTNLDIDDETIEISAEDDDQPDTIEPKIVAKEDKPKKSRWWRFERSHMSKKKWALFIIVMIIFIWTGAVASYRLYTRYSYFEPVVTARVKSKPKPVEPTIVPSNLSGLPVDPAVNNRQVTAIMIENSLDSRPQSGLKDAGIVYEAIAEGGITRFVALYQAEQPDYIGPVRSIRPYYIDFLLPFDAAVAHVGGAPQALIDIKTLGVKDLDQFGNSGAYNRIASRYAPHNVYTSIEKLNALENAKGFTSSKYTGFQRKKDAASKQPNATSVDFNISGFNYSVHYDYDASTNSYKRSVGGKPHLDQRSAAQLMPKVVIALIMSRGIASDGQHTNYGTTGSGAMYVYQDGVITQGTWQKADRRSQFIFTGTDGKPLKLNAGQTWISIVDSGKIGHK